MESLFAQLLSNGSAGMSHAVPSVTSGNPSIASVDPSLAFLSQFTNTSWPQLTSRSFDDFLIWVRSLEMQIRLRPFITTPPLSLLVSPSLATSIMLKTGSPLPTSNSRLVRLLAETLRPPSFVERDGILGVISFAADFSSVSMEKLIEHTQRFCSTASALDYPRHLLLQKFAVSFTGSFGAMVQREILPTLFSTLRTPGGADSSSPTHSAPTTAATSTTTTTRSSAATAASPSTQPDELPHSLLSSPPSTPSASAATPMPAPAPVMPPVAATGASASVELAESLMNLGSYSTAQALEALQPIFETISGLVETAEKGTRLASLTNSLAARANVTPLLSAAAASLPISAPTPAAPTTGRGFRGVRGRGDRGHGPGRDTRRCFLCGQVGHIRSHCPSATAGPAVTATAPTAAAAGILPTPSTAPSVAARRLRPLLSPPSLVVCRFGRGRP